jgi:hypothetical protein
MRITGPGATIGLISAESYRTALRGMGYSISAGFGKASAAIGAQVFTPREDVAGKASTFYRRQAALESSGQ